LPGLRKRSNGTATAAGSVLSKLSSVLALSLTCGSLTMIAALWWYYTVQKHQVEDVAMREIFAVAQFKTDQIANWRSERMGDGRVVMSSPVMQVARRVLASRAVSARDEVDVLDLMTRLSSQFLYADVTLVDLNGKVILRLHEKTTEGAQFEKHTRGQIAREAAKANDVVLSDLRPDTRSGRPMMALAVPVLDLGTWILDIDPSLFLYPYVESWPGHSRTAESLLLRLEGHEIVKLEPDAQVLWKTRYFPAGR
jgi:hypothetical protein